MTDDAELRNINPFDLLDTEAARLDSYYSSLPPTDWARPSRCEGWSFRDVLAHLLASEDYNRACLEGSVQDFMKGLGARGATDMDSANALGVADLAGKQPEELLTAWRQSNSATRRRFRERGDGDVDTSVGSYPCRWQAFHLASELATHADDVSVPVTPGEREQRRDWRARFSRFALAEVKPDVTLKVSGALTRVAGNGIEVEVDDDELIEAVAGRLDDTSRFTADIRALLSTM